MCLQAYFCFCLGRPNTAVLLGLQKMNLQCLTALEIDIYYDKVNCKLPDILVLKCKQIYNQEDKYSILFLNNLVKIPPCLK